MAQKTVYTYKLAPEEQERLAEVLQTGNYRPTRVPYTRVSVRTPDCTINLYTSGKCVVQGKGAEDFVMFVLEPLVLQQAGLGYEEVLDPQIMEPHIGVDESGKGDFFGPLVIAAAYVDADLVQRLRDMNVRDSKSIKSDDKAKAMGRELREVLEGRFSVVRIGPAAYNRLYAKMRNVNTLLGWGHARAIENVLERVPGCPRALSDQFGRKDQVARALMKNGRRIKLEQRPRAETDPAVAAASILAREAFLRSLKHIGSEEGVELLKGASAAVRETAVELVRKKGPPVLLKTAKCHFRTADAVLEEAGYKRADVGPEAEAVSKAAGGGARFKRPRPSS